MRKQTIPTLTLVSVAALAVGGCGAVGGRDDSGGPAARWVGPAGSSGAADPATADPATADPATAGPVPAGPGVPPTVAPNAVLRPTFDTTEGDIAAGTAFVLARDDGSHLLVTAYHLFGPSGGMSRDIPAAELAEVVRGVTAVGAADPSVSVTSRLILDIPGASAAVQSDGTTPIDIRPDVAAFRLADPGRAGVLRLAAEPARAGDRVYLLAELGGSGELMHAATVGDAGPTAVSYEFDEVLQLRGSSGAALLNARGEVVGINAAGGDEDGRTYGLCGPLDALRANLDAAVGR